MILDFKKAPIPTETFDVCVVGAGAAGIALASVLAAKQRRVLLIESGGHYHTRFAQRLNRGSQRGHPLTGLHDGRFRRLGGTTTEWGGQLLELDTIDFESRSWVVGSGWPISRAELAPYYAEAFDFLGMSDALRSPSEIWQTTGIHPLGMAPDFRIEYSTWCRERQIQKVSAHSLARDNLIVAINCTMTKMSIASNGLLQDMEVCSPSLKYQSVKAKHFVLCTGGLETIRLLMQPNKDRAPWHSSHLLGKHVGDHPVATGGSLQFDETAIMRNGHLGNVRVGDLTYSPKIVMRNDVQEIERSLRVAGVLVDITEKSVRIDSAIRGWNKIRQRRVSDVTLTEVRSFSSELPGAIFRRIQKRRGAQAMLPRGSQLTLRVHVEQSPLSASTVKLSQTRDAFGLLRMEVDWRLDGLELQTIRRFVARFASACQAEGLGSFTPHPGLLTDEGLSAGIVDSYHHVGGTRMSQTIENGVVDANLTVHGCSNLSICSSSVFPTGGYSNPTLTILALACRLGARLAAVRT